MYQQYIFSVAVIFVPSSLAEENGVLGVTLTENIYYWFLISLEPYCVTQAQFPVGLCL
jgi:hypothetical protein